MNVRVPRRALPMGTAGTTDARQRRRAASSARAQHQPHAGWAVYWQTLANWQRLQSTGSSWPTRQGGATLDDPVVAALALPQFGAGLVLSCSAGGKTTKHPVQKSIGNWNVFDSTAVPPVVFPKNCTNVSTRLTFAITAAATAWLSRIGTSTTATKLGVVPVAGKAVAAVMVEYSRISPPLVFSMRTL